MVVVVGVSAAAGEKDESAFASRPGRHTLTGAYAMAGPSTKPISSSAALSPESLAQKVMSLVLESWSSIMNKEARNTVALVIAG